MNIRCLIAITIVSFGCSEMPQDKITLTSFYQSGMVKSTRSLDRDSLLEGAWTEYFEDGNPRRQCNFAKGQLNGNCINYYPKGKMEYIAKYVSGELDGNFVSFYANGKVKMVSSYQKGKMHGDQIMYDSLGIELKYQFFAFDGLWYYEKDYQSNIEHSNLRSKYIDIIGLRLPSVVGDTFHACIIFPRPTDCYVRVTLDKISQIDDAVPLMELSTDSGFYHLMHVFDGSNDVWKASYYSENKITRIQDSAFIILDGYTGYYAVDTTKMGKW